MPLNTTNSADVNAYSFLSGVKKVSNVEKIAGDTNGLYWYESGTITLPTTWGETNDDQTFLVTVPGDCRVISASITSSGADSGTAIVVDLIAENAAGNEIVLISGSTVFRTGGGTDGLDESKIGVDISGRKIGLKSTTAGTIVANTAVLKMLVALGPANRGFVQVGSSIFS